jgi:hypothetical protein
LDFVVGLGVAALILGVIGLARAVVEFGIPGLVAFAKLVLAPAALVVGYFLLYPNLFEGNFPRSILPSSHALRVILFILAALAGVTFAFSAAFGVAWLVAK